MIFARFLSVMIVALSARSSFADQGVVLGDSLGEGVAMASGLEKRSALSIHIRGRSLYNSSNEHLKVRPRFSCSARNDALAGVEKLDMYIEKIVRTAETRKIRLVWIGPSCVRTYWDKRAAILDGILQKTLAAKSVLYVSMRDERLCSFEMHGGTVCI